MLNTRRILRRNHSADIMTVVTRFAPSPTGFLHIGGARTALFNWLYARHTGGQFLLRVEDTDRKRSTDEAKAAIIDGLEWLGIDWDGDIVYQSERATRHAEVAREMLAAGNAYHCYCTPEELTAMRETARADGRQPRYDGTWRDRDPADAPAGVDPVIRLKAPRDGETIVADAVQGDVRTENTQLDDMILLRADGTPTYMLGVVVDDHDMGITHIIRGDDHLTNAARQTQIYRAMGWQAPVFAHIPLIHGPDGAKLSKRHGALGIEAYRDMGYLPEAICNYLLRLGWSHGDEEIISSAQAVEWFDVKDVNKGAARFDFAKLGNLNAHYIKAADAGRLIGLIAPLLEARIGAPLGSDAASRLRAGLDGLRGRAKTLTELVENALFYVEARPLALDDKAAALLDGEAKSLLAALKAELDGQTIWDEASLETAVKSFAETKAVKLGMIAQPLRAALTGRTMSPGIFEVMAALGRDEALGRLQDAAG